MFLHTLLEMGLWWTLIPNHVVAGLQLDDALLERQRQAYAVQGVDESEPAQQPKKRKQAYTNGEDVSLYQRTSKTPRLK